MRSNAHFATAALAAAIFLGSARVGFAVACGETVTTKETLTADLNCNTDPALTIAAGGALDMNAFEVTCNGTTDGIVLAADKASVSNGSVGNCSSHAIRLDANDHKVTGVYVFNSPYGIYSANSLNSGHKITNCGFDAVNVGIQLAGSENTISGVSIDAASMGVALLGGNKVTDVTVTNAGARGVSFDAGGNKASNIRIAGAQTGLHSGAANNKYSNIHSADHSSRGIELIGTGNKLSGCTAISDASFSAAVDIYLIGSENKVSNCATLSGKNGIEVLSNDSEVSKNRVFGASERGIYAQTLSSTYKKNFGFGSGTFDFDDIALGCNNNIWSDNTGKKGQSCIE